MQSYITLVFPHIRVTSVPVVYPVIHMKRTTRIMTLASFLDSRAESSIVRSFIHGHCSLSLNPQQKEWRGEAKKTYGVVTKVRFFAPADGVRLSKGYAPWTLRPANYEFPRVS